MKITQSLARKNTLAAAVLVLAGTTLIASAQSPTALESKIKEELLKKPSADKRTYSALTVKASPFQVPKAETCLAAKLYSVEVSKTYDSVTESQDFIYADLPTGPVDLTLPSTSKEVPELLQILNPAFRLAKSADGDLLLSVLVGLYPNRFEKKFGDKGEPRVERKGTTWNFVMGMFFENRKGLAFTTDPAGKITQVGYSLNLGDASTAKDEKPENNTTQKAGDGLTIHQEQEGVSLAVQLGQKEVERMNRESLNLANALEKGKPCTVDFTHPLSGKTMKIQVLGSGSYDMPYSSRYKMEVRLTPENAKKNLLYLKAMSSAKEFTAAGDPIMNGKPVSNVISLLLNKNSSEVQIIELAR